MSDAKSGKRKPDATYYTQKTTDTLGYVYVNRHLTFTGRQSVGQVNGEKRLRDKSKTAKTTTMRETRRSL